ncbi:MAG: biotin--[acetyl-CoA-carboxylase] ligase [Thermodesulfobacteriota bacterium]
MASGLYLVDFDSPDRFAAINPDDLAAAHPVWQADVLRYAPWLQQTGKTPGPLWQSQSYAGPAAIYVCGSVTSTMDAARLFIDSRLMAPGDSLLAVSQWTGRGQRGRSWVSPPGNVYGSWFWPEPTGPDSAWRRLASLMAGDIVATVLEKLGVHARIKWPNDLIVDNRKICGILVEDRGGKSIAGIGLNLASKPENDRIGDDFTLPATCMAHLTAGITPLEFWRQLIESGGQRYQDIVGHMTPAVFVSQLERKMAWTGRQVLVRVGAKSPFSATVLGLAEDGGLRIRCGSRTDTIYNGSLLPESA